MKQISIAQAKILAWSDIPKLQQEEKYCQGDWIKLNARHIADVECGRVTKCFFGTWPKGWKAAMKSEAKTLAKENRLAEFIRDECRYIDGAIWLANLSLIERLVSPNSNLNYPAEK